MKQVRHEFILMASALILVAACARSPKYKEEQTYAKEEPQSYYNKGTLPPQSPTQKLEVAGQPKKRVMVLSFWNDTPVKVDGLGQFSSDEMKRVLYASQKVVVPTDIKTENSTEDFVRGDEIKTSQLIREGKRLGVAVLVIGRISKIVFRSKGEEVGLLRQRHSQAAVDVEIKVFDVLGGREMMATSRSGETESSAVVALEDQNLDSREYRAEMTKLAVRNAISPLVVDVVRSVEKMEWQGHIAKVMGNKIYLNAGRTSGIVAGDILKVLTQGDDIYDPNSGAYLGHTAGQLKGTVEVIDFLGQDGAVAELHTGGNFQEGDPVKLY